jgi:hypothetical protein
MDMKSLNEGLFGRLSADGESYEIVDKKGNVVAYGIPYDYIEGFLGQRSVFKEMPNIVEDLKSVGSSIDSAMASIPEGESVWEDLFGADALLRTIVMTLGGRG